MSSKARRWDQAVCCELGGSEGGSGWLEHGMGVGKHGVELELHLIAPLPNLYRARTRCQALPHPILLISPEGGAVVLGAQRGQVTGLGTHSQ